jgi:hypothetical protein
MVGAAQFLNPQRPEPGEKWKCGVPAQRQEIVYEDLVVAEPSADSQHRPAQVGKRWERGIQAAKPSTQCGRIGHAIGILDAGAAPSQPHPSTKRRRSAWLRAIRL